MQRGNIKKRKIIRYTMEEVCSTLKEIEHCLLLWNDVYPEYNHSVKVKGNGKYYIIEITAFVLEDKEELENLKQL